MPYDDDMTKARRQLGMYHRTTRITWPRNKLARFRALCRQPQFDADMKAAIRLTARAFKLTDAAFIRMAVYRHFYSAWSHASAILEKRDSPKWKRERLQAVMTASRWVVDHYDCNTDRYQCPADPHNSKYAVGVRKRQIAGLKARREQEKVLAS